MKKITLCCALLVLSGCTYLTPQPPQISALADDPATYTQHTTITSPWATIINDVTRVNSVNTAATAGNNGTAVNVPLNSTVNTAPSRPAAGTTVMTGAPAQ